MVKRSRKQPFIQRVAQNMMVGAVAVPVVFLVFILAVLVWPLGPRVTITPGVGSRLWELLPLLLGYGALIGLGGTRPDPPNRVLSIFLVSLASAVSFILWFIVVWSPQSKLADTIVFAFIMALGPALLCSINQFVSKQEDQTDDP
jgi:hypothetical protein